MSNGIDFKPERRRFARMAAGLAVAGAASGGTEDAHASPTKSGAIGTVNRFLDACWTLKPEPTLALVHEDFTWINMPMADSPIYTINGKEALRKVMTSGDGGFPEPIEAGKVISWRDYFDFGTYVRQMESIGIKAPQ